MKKYFKLFLVMILLLAFILPASAIKIAPYSQPLHDIMHWDVTSAKLIIQNPENENQTVSWPATVDLWNYNGNSWTYDLPDGDKFAFSKRVDFNVSTTEGAGSTVRGISLTDTVGAAGAIHEGVYSLVTSAFATGSWTNAVVGVITYSATGSASGGMAAALCGEINMQAAASSGGSYYNVHSYFSVPTAAELIDSTAFNYAFERYELADNASYDFGLYGLLWHVVGLYDHSGKVWYDNTLKIQIDTTKWWIPLSEAEGSYTTSYPIVVSGTFPTATSKAMKSAITINNANLTDGYGANEFDLTLTGTMPGSNACLSAWVNVGASATINVGGAYTCAMNVGVYEGAATELANARIIFGMRMQKLITDTPDRACPFSVNTNNTGITAIFDVQTRTDLSDDDADGESYTADGWVPLYIDNGGNVRYIRTYR